MCEDCRRRDEDRTAAKELEAQRRSVAAQEARAAERDRIAALDEVKAAADLVAALYRLPGCDAGGPLHVVVDDYNTDDFWVGYHVAKTLARHEANGFVHSDEVWQAAEAVMRALSGLEVEERTVACITGHKMALSG